MLRNFTHITIPAEIWLRRDISMQAKALWAELRSLHDLDVGGCYASDDYLCEFMGLKRSRLHEVFKELKDFGLMQVVSFDGRKTIRKAIVPDVIYDKNEGGGQQLSGKPDTSYPENRTPPIRKTGFALYIDNKEENKAKKIDASPSRKKAEKNSSHPATPIRAKDIEFDHESKKFKGISKEDEEVWHKLYPDISLQNEILRSEQWVLANPSKSKKSLWRKFLTGWFEKAQEKAFRQKAYNSNSLKIDRRTKNKDGTPIETPYDNLF